MVIIWICFAGYMKDVVMQEEESCVENCFSFFFFFFCFCSFTGETELDLWRVWFSAYNSSKSLKSNHRRTVPMSNLC